jgi:predicted nucleic acid-binding protein
MIFMDANILVSAAIGKRTRQAFDAAVGSGIELGVPEAQIAEAARVLVEKIGLSRATAGEALRAMTGLVLPVAHEFYAAQEHAARARLHERAQPDWPVLAAALAVDGGIWSHDRDFFGVGAPVWSTRNLRYAAEDQSMASDA